MDYRIEQTGEVVSSEQLHARLAQGQWAVDWDATNAAADPEAALHAWVLVDEQAAAEPAIDRSSARLNAEPLTGSARKAAAISRSIDARAVAGLADSSKHATWEVPDVVSYGDGDTQVGIVAAVYTSAFDWPTDNDASGDDGIEEVDASTDDPVYIVARLGGGGAGVYAESELSDGSFPDSVEEPDPENVEEANLASVYSDMDDPGALIDFRVAYAQRTGRAELLNVKGIDDPEVGFASWPNGWDRGSLMQFWVSVGGSWTTCNDRMKTHFGPGMARRFCSAAKDELLGTERWRNRF